MQNERTPRPDDDRDTGAPPPQPRPPGHDGVDEASEESFPASDPPAFTPSHPGPPGDHPD